MKKTIAAALLFSTVGASAFAADLPSRKAPILLPPPPVFTWAGFYVGLNAGATFSNRNTYTVVGAPVFTNPTIGGVAPIQTAIDTALTGIGSTSNSTGAILGAQAGYNYQFGSSFLIGFETDIQGVIQSSSRGLFGSLAPIAGAAPFFVQGIGAVQKRTDWLGTARARLGYTFAPSFLLYVTGGAAYGGVKSSTVTAPSIQPAALVGGALPISGSYGGYSSTRVGYSIGGGGEWMFMPNWSLKAEYLYYNLGSARYNSVSNFNIAAGGVNALLAQDAISTRVRYDGHIARLGVNYHFWAPVGGPVVARY